MDPATKTGLIVGAVVLAIIVVVVIIVIVASTSNKSDKDSVATPTAPILKKPDDTATPNIEGDWVTNGGRLPINLSIKDNVLSFQEMGPAFDKKPPLSSPILNSTPTTARVIFNLPEGSGQKVEMKLEMNFQRLSENKLIVKIIGEREIRNLKRSYFDDIMKKIKESSTSDWKPQHPALTEEENSDMEWLASTASTAPTTSTTSTATGSSAPVTGISIPERKFNHSIDALSLVQPVIDRQDGKAIVPKDLGYSDGSVNSGNFKRGYYNLDGTGANNYCRYVGMPPKEYLACTKNDQEYYYTTAGLDQGYASWRGIFTLPRSNEQTFCREVGDNVAKPMACIPIRNDAFDKDNQYHLMGKATFVKSHTSG